MAGILQDPVKAVMLIILVAMEIPAAVVLIVGWIKACREARGTIPKGNANKNQN